MECPYIPTVSYAQFSERLYEKVAVKRIPINGSFELTFHCNLRCVHCYCNLPLDEQGTTDKELSTSEVFDIFDQITDAGCLWLLLTGGECLLRKDFFHIWAYAKKKGLLPTLFTNGTLITREIADFLVEFC